MLRYALALALGRLGHLPDYKVIPTTSLRITGPGGEPVQLDGDIGARLPADIALAPERLLLVTRRKPDRRRIAKTLLWRFAARVWIIDSR